MSVTVRVPTILRTYTDGSAEVSVEVADGATLADVLAALEADHTGIAARVRDEPSALGGPASLMQTPANDQPDLPPRS